MTGAAPFLDDQEPEAEGPDGALSYLDIVTAAFGSAIFLLFVFATLPIDQAGGAGADQYIDVQFEYDGEAQIELQVARDGQLVFRTLDPGFNPDPRTGNSGLPNTDDYRSVHISNAQDSKSSPKVLGFRVIGPSPGLWAVFANAAETANPFGDPVAKVSARVFASCAQPCEPVLAGGAKEQLVDLSPMAAHVQVVSFDIAGD